MNNEVLDSIVPNMSDDEVVELVHNHLCGLRVIENKDREDIRIEYNLEEDIEDNSREELINALYKMNEKIMKSR